MSPQKNILGGGGEGVNYSTSPKMFGHQPNEAPGTATLLAGRPCVIRLCSWVSPVSHVTLHCRPYRSPCFGTHPRPAHILHSDLRRECSHPSLPPGTWLSVSAAGAFPSPRWYRGSRQHSWNDRTPLFPLPSSSHSETPQMCTALLPCLGNTSHCCRITQGCPLFVRTLGLGSHRRILQVACQIPSVFSDSQARQDRRCHLCVVEKLSQGF